MSTSSDRSHGAEGRLAPSFLLLVYVNAFVTGAVVMGFEMLGSRYLNPYFGSGIYTWAALISTVLAALTGGYFFGGWMADRKPTPAGLGWLILAGSAYLAFIPLFAEPLMEFLSSRLGGLSDQREFERWGSIIGAMLLLFVPLALLGVYSPYAIRLTLRATSRSGTVAGRIYGISTLGSIFGTLFVTFYLIPTMGSRHITYLLSAIGVAAGLSFLVVRPARVRRALPAVAALMLVALAAPQPLLAEAPPAESSPRAHLAQAGPEAKEMAERFLAHLKKQGYTVEHGGIEAGPPPSGFRLKNISLSEPNRGSWRAAWIEMATFEERASGETAMTGFAAEGLEGSSGKDKDALKAARLAAASATWTTAPKIEIKISGVALRALETVAANGDVMKLSELDIERLRLDVPTGGALDHLSARGFTYSSKSESGSLTSMTVESAEVAVSSRIAFKNIVFSDLVANPPAQGAIRIAAIELRALEILNPADRNPGDLRVLDFAIKRIEAPLAGARDEAFARDMMELGYTTLKMSAELVYRYEEASKTFNLAKLEFDVAEMGALTLAFKIAGLSPEDIKKAMEPPQTPPGQSAPPGSGSREGAAAMGLLARLNLVAADLSYRDKSILGRVFKREAQRKQTDEASIRAQYRALLVGLRDEQTDPLAKEAIDTLIAFLENPGELVVEVRPPAPLNLLAVGAMAAANPAQLRTLLGVKITAKKP